MLNVGTLYDATVLIAEALREVMTRDQSKLTHKADLSCSFIVGGQIADGEMGIFNIYSQGNFIQATEDMPFLQLGESKYGKPILDRVVKYSTPLDEALRCGLISLDSTIRSNMSVGMPLDVLVYRRGGLAEIKSFRTTNEDPYFNQLRCQWGDGLKSLLSQLPPPPKGYMS